MRRLLRLVLLGALGTATAASTCDEGSPDKSIAPSIPSLTGTWAGVMERLTMRLTLSERDGSVTGSGTMFESGVPRSLSVAGTVANGAFSLTISRAERAPFIYTGSIQVTGAATTMVGVGNGSGFQNEPMTLTKQ
jgi:hypothetical protein